MRRSRLCDILIVLLFAGTAYAQDTVSVAPIDTTAAVERIDTTAVVAKVKKPRAQIYQGTTVKLDILTPVLVCGLNKWQMQQYEVAVNVRLKNHFYPTLEVGFGGGHTEQGDTLTYDAYGGFFRAGLDVNPLRRNPESPHALLIGIRVGTGIQAQRTDCWGEIVAGCQVEIAKVKKTAFYMGWQGRFKVLFTRQPNGLTTEECWPIYIPGFGHRSDLGWGASYHLGWKF